MTDTKEPALDDSVIWDAAVSLDFHYAANLFRVIGDVLHSTIPGDRNSVIHALEQANSIAAAGEAMMRNMVEECDRRQV